MWISAAEHRNKRSVLVETYPSRSADLRDKGPPYNQLSQNESAKRPQAKTSIWAGATPVFVRFCRPKVLTGSLPPKSPIGDRQGPFGAPKAKKFIFLEMFFELLAH